MTNRAHASSPRQATARAQDSRPEQHKRCSLRGSLFTQRHATRRHLFPHRGPLRLPLLTLAAQATWAATSPVLANQTATAPPSSGVSPPSWRRWRRPALSPASSCRLLTFPAKPSSRQLAQTLWRYSQLVAPQRLCAKRMGTRLLGTTRQQFNDKQSRNQQTIVTSTRIGNKEISNHVYRIAYLTKLCPVQPQPRRTPVAPKIASLAVYAVRASHPSVSNGPCVNRCLY